MEEKIANFFYKHEIKIDEIKYVIRDDKKTKIYLNNGKVVSTFIPIKNFVNELLSYDFLNINKGILVSKKLIDHIDNSIYYMIDGTNFEGRKRTVGAHKHLNELLKVKNESLSNIDISKRFAMLDDMPVAFCVIELVFNENGNSVDFIFRYCNKQMEVLEGKKIEEMLNHSFYKVFPKADNKWLVAYSNVAVTGEQMSFKEYSPEIGKDLLIQCFQPMEGFCACLLSPIEDIKGILTKSLAKD